MVWLVPFVIGFLLISWQILKEWFAGKSLGTRWLVTLSGITALVRVPSILYNRVTNVDEAQTIAHALTLMRFPTPWKGVDFTTNGPLNAYVFYLPAWMGISLDYLVSHIILAALLAILCISIFITIRNWMSQQTAVVAMIPLLLFISFGQRDDFVHHASEFWCVTLLSLALMIFSDITTNPGKRTWQRWFLTGLLLGMVPFGKPQGVPPALLAALGIYGYLVVYEKGVRRWRALAIFTMGGLLFAFVFTTVAFLNGAWNDFYDLYLVANLNYAAKHSEGLTFIPSFLWRWAWNSGVSLIFLITFSFALAGLFSQSRISKKDRQVGLFLLAVCYGGAYAVERAGRPFDHYLLLFVFPGLFLLLGWGLHQLSSLPRKRLIVFAGLLMMTGYLLLTNREYYQRLTASFINETPWRLTVSPVSKYVKQWASESEDCITVYGYYNEIYVETQLPSATRLVTVYQHSAIWPELYTPYYYRDITVNRPVVVVDALDTPTDFRQTFVNRKEHAPERIPEIAQFLKENYQLMKVIDRSRVYVRNDRVAERDDTGK